MTNKIFDVADLVQEQEATLRVPGTLGCIVVCPDAEYHCTRCGNFAVIVRKRQTFHGSSFFEELFCEACKIVVWPGNLEPAEERKYRILRLIRCGETEESATNIVDLQQLTERQAEASRHKKRTK